MDFRPFPKIPRLRRDITVTEKIDGSNGQVAIFPIADVGAAGSYLGPAMLALSADQEFCMFAGSRTRWITPESDNFGFAAWVKKNAEELFQLGPGHHFGEWWGSGIQRNYGLKTRHFSLFNVGRWKDAQLPGCVDLVPVLYEGPWSAEAIDEIADELRGTGSFATYLKGHGHFPSPEGICVYHHAGNHYYKVLLENDETPKGAQP